MTRDVAVVTRDTNLQDVALLMRDEDTGIIPVVDVGETHDVPEDSGEQMTAKSQARRHSHGKLVGLITDRDIVVRAVAEGRDSKSVRAEEVMTTEIYSAREDDRVIDIIRMMGDKQVRRIPVVSEDGILHGIISMADVVLEIEADHELAGALEEISSGASFWNRVFG
jgi:CBS domain-containing protein